MDIIEHSMDEKRVISWMRGHWYWSFFYSALYLALIFLGQKLMKDRPPYNLRRALCMWSTGLSVFSFYAFYRTFPLVYSSLKVGGFQHVVCDINLYTGSKGVGIWIFNFTCFKLIELLDTAFLIARKRKIIFLHWYHHLLTLIFCYYCYSHPTSVIVLNGTINAFVHIIMYAYYAVTASGRRLPRVCACFVTTLQLLQFFVTLCVMYVAIRSYYGSRFCGMDNVKIGLCLVVYVSFFVLFIDFFYRKYVQRGEKIKKL